MRYETIRTLGHDDFERAIGVHRATFDTMLAVVENGLRPFGRPPKLSRADQLLLTLMYWREYRTEFHIGLAYGVSEATVCRTIRKIEQVLMTSERFHLPGKQHLLSHPHVHACVLVDATEQPIERPKKTSVDFTAANNDVTPIKLK